MKVTLDDVELEEDKDYITIKSLECGAGITISDDSNCITILGDEKKELLWAVFEIEGERRREQEGKTNTS